MIMILYGISSLVLTLIVLHVVVAIMRVKERARLDREQRELDPCCEHGVAWDVACPNCDSGFIFNEEHKR
jgi:hypothetical protein